MEKNDSDYLREDLARSCKCGHVDECVKKIGDYATKIRLLNFGNPYNWENTVKLANIMLVFCDFDEERQFWTKQIEYYKSQKKINNI